MKRTLVCALKSYVIGPTMLLTWAVVEFCQGYAIAFHCAFLQSTTQVSLLSYVEVQDREHAHSINIDLFVDAPLKGRKVLGLKQT